MPKHEYHCEICNIPCADRSGGPEVGRPYCTECERTLWHLRHLERRHVEKILRIARWDLELAESAE